MERSICLTFSLPVFTRFTVLKVHWNVNTKWPQKPFPHKFLFSTIWASVVTTSIYLLITPVQWLFQQNPKPSWSQAHKSFPACCPRTAPTLSTSGHRPSALCGVSTCWTTWCWTPWNLQIPIWTSQMEWGSSPSLLKTHWLKRMTKVGTGTFCAVR